MIMLGGCSGMAINTISPNTILYFYSNASVDADADAWRRKAVRPESLSICTDFDIACPHLLTPFTSL